MDTTPPSLLINERTDASPKNVLSTIALAHGAGAPMDSTFMNDMADGLAQNGLRVVRFEFPYMAQRRETGKGKPPNREPILRQTWHQVIDQLGPTRLFIGGKSMGGRMASMVADECQVTGLVCLGYPFHPVGKPEKLRTAHLESIQTPTLIVQGERDPFGTKAEVDGFDLSKKIRFHWLPDGDHSFKPRKSSGHTLDQNMCQAIQEIARFVTQT